MTKTSRSLLYFGALALTALTPVIGSAAPLQRTKQTVNAPQQVKPQQRLMRPNAATKKQPPKAQAKNTFAKPKAIYAKSSHHYKKSSSEQKSCCKSVISISEHDINKASRESSSG